MHPQAPVQKNSLCYNTSFRGFLTLVEINSIWKIFTAVWSGKGALWKEFITLGLSRKICFQMSIYPITQSKWQDHLSSFKNLMSIGILEKIPCKNFWNKPPLPLHSTNSAEVTSYGLSHKFQKKYINKSNNCFTHKPEKEKRKKRKERRTFKDVKCSATNTSLCGRLSSRSDL